LKVAKLSLFPSHATRRGVDAFHEAMTGHRERLGE
jgi:hypothetical protein